MGRYDIYIIKTKATPSEYRVRPAVTAVRGGTNAKLKIRNLTDYTAKLTFEPGFLDQTVTVGNDVSIASGTKVELVLADGLDGYYEYQAVINIGGANTWEEAKGESAPSVIVDP